jgi:hypothetical protein
VVEDNIKKVKIRRDFSGVEPFVSAQDEGERIRVRQTTPDKKLENWKEKGKGQEIS